MSSINRQWLLKERPIGMVGPEHFELVQSEIPSPDLASGEVLIKTLMLGFDPAMRGWLMDERSYLPPVAIGQMADFGRIALCGGISGYNDNEPQPGPNNLMLLVGRRIKMQGFIVLDYLDRAEEATAYLADLVMAGKLAWREDVQEGFDNIPATLKRLFDGANVGKQMLKLADPE